MVEVVVIAETRFYREGLALALHQAGNFDVVAAAAPAAIRQAPGSAPGSSCSTWGIRRTAPALSPLCEQGTRKCA
ncbi:hypothetical protein ACFQ0O_25475 [Saccharopolyspora spinosporotrichia]